MALNGYWGFPSHPLKSSNQMRLKCTVKPILSSQLPISPICSHLSFPMFPTFQWLSLYISVYYIYIYVSFHIRPMPSPSHHGRHLKGCRLRGRRLQQLQRQLPQPRPATFVFSPGQAELRDGDELQDEVTRSVPGWLMLWHMMAYKMAHWYSWSDGETMFWVQLLTLFLAHWCSWSDLETWFSPASGFWNGAEWPIPIIF